MLDCFAALAMTAGMTPPMLSHYIGRVDALIAAAPMP